MLIPTEVGCCFLGSPKLGSNLRGCVSPLHGPVAGVFFLSATSEIPVVVEFHTLMVWDFFGGPIVECRNPTRKKKGPKLREVFFGWRVFGVGI